MGFINRACLPVRTSLGDWVKDRFTTFPSSGEINFRVEDAAQAIEKVLNNYKSAAISIDHTDGASLEFANWRFNLRCSNTEHLVRLNIETKGCGQALEAKVSSISDLLGGTRA